MRWITSSNFQLENTIEMQVEYDDSILQHHTRQTPNPKTTDKLRYQYWHSSLPRESQGSIKFDHFFKSEVLMIRLDKTIDMTLCHPDCMLMSSHIDLLGWRYLCQLNLNLIPNATWKITKIRSFQILSVRSNSIFKRTDFSSWIKYGKQLERFSLFLDGKDLQLIQIECNGKNSFKQWIHTFRSWTNLALGSDWDFWSYIENSIWPEKTQPWKVFIEVALVLHSMRSPRVSSHHLFMDRPRCHEPSSMSR